MNHRFQGILLMVLLAQSVWPGSAGADIVPSEDLEDLSTDSVDAVGSASGSLQPEISVEAGAGTVTLPYSPPDLGNYQNGMRYALFRFGLHRAFESEGVLSKSFYFIRLKNCFPVSGRSYDVQAVSWFDLDLVGGVEGQLNVREATRLSWLGAAEVAYERIHYPRGTLALYGTPLKVGAFIQRETTISESIVAVGLGGEYAYLAFGRTAVKHDSFAVSKSATANRVKFQPDRVVSGHALSFALNIDFSSTQWREVQASNLQHKHQLSFTYESKVREAKDVAVEYNTTGIAQDASHLDLKQTSFGLRWSERL